jgi:hypothetical protein
VQLALLVLTALQDRLDQQVLQVLLDQQVLRDLQESTEQLVQRGQQVRLVQLVLEQTRFQ